MGLITSESESESSMFSPSSVLRGLKPSLLLPKMSPTFQCFFPFPPAPEVIVPFPRFRHLL